jgi:hypothetical protein
MCEVKRRLFYRVYYPILQRSITIYVKSDSVRRPESDKLGQIRKVESAVLR